MKDLKTAIVIFAHSAEYEAIVKPFQYAEEVFESLNQRTLQIVKKTNLPFFVFTEKEQIGTTFGERFTNVLQSVYDLDYNSLIVIGNDTPHLTSNQLTKANKKLSTSDVVLGSSIDGGFYLLGIKREHFNAALFLRLPWQSQSLSGALTKLFKVNVIKVSYLEKLRDLDSCDDIEQLFNSFKTVYSKLFQLFLIIISKIKNTIYAIAVNSSFLFQSNAYNKGSPYLFK